MESNERFIDHLGKADRKLDKALRPQSLGDFVGQEKIKEQLHIMIEASKIRKDSIDHLLFSGPPGLGKTTLSNIIAGAMDKSIHTTSGPVIDKPGDLAGILTSLEEGDILFIDEIHRLNNIVEEYLYSAMEDHFIDILIDKGPAARSVKIDLLPFTLIGATTRSGLLTSPLRSRFGVVFHLNFYELEDLIKIVNRNAGLLDLQVNSQGAYEIARRSRGTARIANNLLRRVRDYALVKKKPIIDDTVASEALELLSVDQKGLDEMDIKILEVLINHHSGGPVGMSTLAIAVGEDPATLEDVYEPYLIMSGFIKRTPQGRVATPQAYTHLGLDSTGFKQKGLF